jgi:hypothetical protein
MDRPGHSSRWEMGVRQELRGGRLRAPQVLAAELELGVLGQPVVALVMLVLVAQVLCPEAHSQQATLLVVALRRAQRRRQRKPRAQLLAEH